MNSSCNPCSASRSCELREGLRPGWLGGGDTPGDLPTRARWRWHYLRDVEEAARLAREGVVVGGRGPWTQVGGPRFRWQGGSRRSAPAWGRLAAQPAGEMEVAPDERLPPGQLGPELRRPTTADPTLQGQGNALEVEGSDPTLPPLPTNADQTVPTPSGPCALCMRSHHLVLESACTEHVGRGQRLDGACEHPAPNARQARFHTLPLFCAVAGRTPSLQQACQLRGRRGELARLLLRAPRPNGAAHVAWSCAGLIPGTGNAVVRGEL